MIRGPLGLATFLALAVVCSGCTTSGEATTTAFVPPSTTTSTAVTPSSTTSTTQIETTTTTTLAELPFVLPAIGEGDDCSAWSVRDLVHVVWQPTSDAANPSAVGLRAALVAAATGCDFEFIAQAANPDGEFWGATGLTVDRLQALDETNLVMRDLAVTLASTTSQWDFVECEEGPTGPECDDEFLWWPGYIDLDEDPDAGAIAVVEGLESKDDVYRLLDSLSGLSLPRPVVFTVEFTQERHGGAAWTGAFTRTHRAPVGRPCDADLGRDVDSLAVGDDGCFVEPSVVMVANDQGWCGEPGSARSITTGTSIGDRIASEPQKDRRMYVWDREGSVLPGGPYGELTDSRFLPDEWEPSGIFVGDRQIFTLHNARSGPGDHILLVGIEDVEWWPEASVEFCD